MANMHLREKSEMSDNLKREDIPHFSPLAP